MPSSWWPRSSRSTTVSCWYCNTSLPLHPPQPPNAAAKGKGRAVDGAAAVGSVHDFWCGVCGCWNRRNELGEIVSDEPAQKDPELNKDSFAKRAAPDPSHLPPQFAKSPFCRTCLANQSLQIHLLASFPSDSDNSDDPSALPHLLPEYKRSLDSRYPLLCAACAPAVEEVIKERDYRAKTQALGWRLNASRGLKKEKEKREQRRRKEGWDWWCLGVVWRIRGAAWWGTHVAGIVACLLALAVPQAFTEDSASLATALDWIPRSAKWSPLFALLSFFWVFWDATWDRARKERARGRKPDVAGREVFVAIQMLLYLVRLSLSIMAAWRFVDDPTSLRRIAGGSLALLLIALVASCSTLHIEEPVNIRLTSSRRPSPASATLDPLSPLAELSLSPFPSTPPSSTSPPPLLRKRPPPRAPQPPQPTFGVPSFPQSSLSRIPASQNDDMDFEILDDENSMDWDPLPANDAKPRGWDFNLAPQRFFAPQQPSGLEGIFEKSLRVADEEKSWWRKLVGR